MAVHVKVCNAHSPSTPWQSNELPSAGRPAGFSIVILVLFHTQTNRAVVELKTQVSLKRETITKRGVVNESVQATSNGCSGMSDGIRSGKVSGRQHLNSIRHLLGYNLEQLDFCRMMTISDRPRGGATEGAKLLWPPARAALGTNGERVNPRV